MDIRLENRNDLIRIFNTSRFTLHHYARGYYPTKPLNFSSMPVNRMFFPLHNPNGPENFIADGEHHYELIPGNLYFIPAFLPARFQLDDDLYFLSIQATLEIFPGVEFFSGCSHMLEIPLPPEYYDLMELFDSEDTETIYQTGVKAGSLIYSMLTGIFQHYALENFRKPMALFQYIDLINYLSANGNAQTSVSDLAALKKLSRENFTRHLTADTGITPKQLIDRFVINRCLILIGQGHSFTEIARIMKFPDEFAFSRYFKRNIGESPRAWKQSGNKNYKHIPQGES